MRDPSRNIRNAIRGLLRARYAPIREKYGPKGPKERQTVFYWLKETFWAWCEGREIGIKAFRADWIRNAVNPGVEMLDL